MSDPVMSEHVFEKGANGGLLPVSKADNAHAGEPPVAPDGGLPRASCAGPDDRTPVEKKPGLPPDVDTRYAHCLSAGRLFQAVGLVMFLGSAALWATSGLILIPAAEPAERWADYLSGPYIGSAVLTIDIIATCVGGLGLIGAGVGFSNLRRSAGRVALVVTALLAFIFLASTVSFAMWVRAWFAAFLTGVLGLLATGLTLMAAHCASILKRFPPPAHNVATEDILEQYRKERDERRKAYDI